MKSALGLDVADGDGQVDWKKAAAGGISFAFIKATAGCDYVDPLYQVNWSDAGGVGILRGAYHWYTPTQDPIKQVEWFLEHSQAGELADSVDLEDKRYTPNLADKVLTFLIELERRTGRKPIVYTSPDYWNVYMKRPDWGDQYPLWIANYKVNVPAIPLPWAPMRWDFWQWTATYPGAHFGVEAKGLDLDLFNGGEAELRGWPWPGGTSRAG